MSQIKIAFPPVPLIGDVKEHPEEAIKTLWWYLTNLRDKYLPIDTTRVEPQAGVTIVHTDAYAGSLYTLTTTNTALATITLDTIQDAQIVLIGKVVSQCASPGVLMTTVDYHIYDGDVDTGTSLDVGEYSPDLSIPNTYSLSLPLLGHAIGDGTTRTFTFSGYKHFDSGNFAGSYYATMVRFTAIMG